MLLRTLRSLRIVEVAGLMVFVAVIFAGCGGAPEVRQNANGTKISDPIPRLTGTGAVYVRLNEMGEDMDVTGSMVAPLVVKALADAGVKTAESDNKADFVLQGVIKLCLKNRKQRLGIDECTYGAQAALRLLQAGGYREISVHEVAAEGRGTGRSEAITRTLTDLAGKIASDVLPSLRQLTARK